VCKEGKDWFKPFFNIRKRTPLSPHLHPQFFYLPFFTSVTKNIIFRRKNMGAFAALQIPSYAYAIQGSVPGREKDMRDISFPKHPYPLWGPPNILFSAYECLFIWNKAAGA
jgi:hypothetical protein